MTGIDFDARADEVERQAEALREQGWSEQGALNGALDNVVDDTVTRRPRQEVYRQLEQALGFRGTAFESGSAE